MMKNNNCVACKLMLQIKLLKKKNAEMLFRVNEYSCAIKAIAEENAKLKFKVNDLEEENNLLRYKLGIKEANNYCLTVLGKEA